MAKAGAHLSCVLDRGWTEAALLRNSHADPSGCRLWDGAVKQAGGYGLASIREDGPVGRHSRVRIAHRVAYEIWTGPLPVNLTIDHLCRVRHCVEPTHLEAVTWQVNVLRGDTLAARNSLKTHCSKGHPYSGENLRTTRRGDRMCRTCDWQRYHGADKEVHLPPFRLFKTHCIRGHEFTAENTYLPVRRGRPDGRSCRACATERQRLYKSRTS